MTNIIRARSGVITQFLLYLITEKEFKIMEIKYTEEELNSIDKSLLIKMFLNLQNQMETLTGETRALNDKMQKMME